MPTQLALYDPIRTLDHAVTPVTNAYQLVGLQFTKTVKILHVTSTFNQAVYISTDGVNDHIYIYPGTSFVHDLGAARGHGDQNYGHPATGGIYIKNYAAASPVTTGQIFVTISYTRG